MNKQEFESLVGQKTTDEDFDRFNEIYMNAGEVDKETFCNAVKNLHKLPGTWEVIEALSKTSTIRNDKLARCDKERREAALMLIQISAKYQDEQARKKAIQMLGTNNYLREKISLGLDFDANDYELVVDFL